MTNGESKIVVPGAAEVVIEDKPIVPPKVQILGNRIMMQLRPDMELLHSGKLQKKHIKGVQHYVIGDSIAVPVEHANKVRNNAIVVAIGDGDRINPKLKPGVRIFVGNNHGWPCAIGDQVFHLIAADDAIMVIDL